MTSRAEWERKIWSALQGELTGAEPEVLLNIEGVFLSEAEWDRIGKAWAEVSDRVFWLQSTPEERKKITSRSRTGGRPRRGRTI